MLETIERRQSLTFLPLDTEMGVLTRNYDWDTSTLGPPEDWPLSLQITVGNVLRCAFPMFLFWGPELTCFYNDAFRPSLGNEGKHPAVGRTGREVWPEIWPFIGPLIDGVLNTGKPVWFEDQLVPFYRNGRMEDIYWTFSYSPACGDDGSIQGVLVTCMETTGQVMNHKKLKESEDTLRFAIEAAELGTWDFDPRTNTYTSNDRLNEWFGLPPGTEMLLQNAIEVIAPRDRQRVAEAIEKAMQYETGGYYQAEFTIIHPHTHTERIVSAKGRAWFGPDKQCYRFNGTLQDVTTQATARNKIKESAQKLSAFIESAPFPIGVYIGRDMVIEFANRSIIDVWGKGDDVIGKRYADILPELENQQIYEQLDQVFTTGIPFHARNQRVDLQVDGRLGSYYFNYSFTPLFDSEGNVYGVMNTAAEVTDLHEAKQQVELREMTMRNMILQAPVAMCIIRGENLIIEIANKKMFELWGKTEDILGRPLFEAVPEAKDQGYEKLLENVMRNGASFSAEESPITLLRDGTVKPVFLNFSYEPIREADDSISGVMAVAIDVTDQVQARHKIEEIVAQRTAELARANDELKRSNANLEEFAHAASHDLKEPIRKIHFFTEQVKAQLTEHLTDREIKSFNRIENATLRMGNLIDDLLLYSHVSQRPHEMEHVNLNQNIRDVLEDLELDIQEKKAVVEVKNLPVVEGFRRQLQQLFQNLISNALKYSKADEAPHIVISAGKATENGRAYHLISVKDNGIGFEQHYEDKIFQMFSRLHGRSEYSGTGVGLSIAKKVVENHNGLIRAESEPGEGATFYVYLPVNEALQ